MDYQDGDLAAQSDAGYEMNMDKILMSGELSKIANERGGDGDNYIKTAFNEILGTIYITAMSEKGSDKLIEELAYFAMEKLDIKEGDFNWQTIEEWIHIETYNLTDYHLDFSEIKKIIAKSKVTDHHEWEDIESKEIPLDKINKKMIEDFKETLDAKIHIYTKKEVRKRYLNNIH